MHDWGSCLVTILDDENSNQLHGCSRFRTGRAGGCTTKDQALRLRERDVAPVRQRRDAQAAAVANVLVVILDLCVADVDLRSSTPLDGFGCALVFRPVHLMSRTWHSRVLSCCE